MSEPALPTPEQQAAQEKLDGILRDREHPYHVQGPRTEAAIQEVLGLRRQILGERNTVAGPTYREATDDAPPPQATETLTITRADLPMLAPGAWTPAQTERVVTTAVDALGATPYEVVRLFNITATDPPEKEIADLGQLWGTDDAETDRNIALINNVLSRLRAVDADLYARILPFAQRDPAMVNALLAFAKRRAGHAPRSAPARPRPAGESADRDAAGWPFIWADE